MPQIPYSQEFELYHYQESLCSQMVRIALAEKGYAWASHLIQLEEVALHGDNLSDAYLQVNPKGQVPTLVHNGVPVYDSYEIIRYLDRLHPDHGTRLVPEDPTLDAQVQAWVRDASLREDVRFGKNLGTAIPVLSSPLIKACIDRQPILPLVKKFQRHPVPGRRLGFVTLRLLPIMPKVVFHDSVTTVAKALVNIEHALQASAGPFLLGPFTQADVMMMAHFHRLEDVALGDLLNSDLLPHTRAYWQRLQARPAYKIAVTDWHEHTWRRAIDQVFQGQPSKRLPALKKKIAKWV